MKENNGKRLKRKEREMDLHCERNLLIRSGYSWFNQKSPKEEAISFGVIYKLNHATLTAQIPL